MNTRDLENFRTKLLAEKASLERELSGVAEKNPDNPSGWQATTTDIEVDAADENELADKLEELEDNSGIASQLDSQLKEVTAALERIDKGTYGACEICGKPIERERLEANPSARISIKHGHPQTVSPK
ncbi:MAG: TraR/DksA C4-type zinc finger protein [Patescibacteria group bacterium]|nr:TraR/DksA C4-type zinc finger protein [Patescibacteria group bacterium]MDE2172680.1 TraR/DksA C4-type zinc finger protein [Patescibacteria group bacterium]